MPVLRHCELVAPGNWLGLAKAAMRDVPCIGVHFSLKRWRVVVLVAAATFVTLPTGHAFASSGLANRGAAPGPPWHAAYDSDATGPSGDDLNSASLADRTALEPRSFAVLVSGQSLSVGQKVVSPNGWYELTLRPDGNLVLHVPMAPAGVNGTLWASGSTTTGVPQLVLHGDGELAVYGTLIPERTDPAFRTYPGGSVTKLWSADTRSESGAALRLDDSGGLSVIAANGRVLWRSGNSVPDVGLAGERHVVYERGQQWVWLVDADGSVVDNYPVSGHLQSPALGRYRVTSKSKTSTSYNGLVTMRHMVRFTVGYNGGRIGFHSIPRNWSNKPIQTEAELGNALSLGCVRQRDDKAKHLYQWAPIGTPVVVIS